MKQSHTLTMFYIEYKEWLERGASEDHRYFKRDQGLCSSLLRFGSHNGVVYCDRRRLLTEMKTQFSMAGLWPAYPFNRNSDEYLDETLGHHTAHKNPLRIQWVEEHANETLLTSGPEGPQGKDACLHL